DTPTFVYNQGVGVMGLTVSHEVGHMLGLNHDGESGVEYYPGHGSGDTSWGPIMGAPFNENVTQWSAGDYNDSSNSENDLSVIVGQNGFGYRTDDVGNSNAAASELELSNDSQSVHAFGIIEENTDRDIYSFVSGAGNVSLDIDPAANFPNLDVWAGLYDSAGNLMAQSNPGGDVSASISTSVSGGTYYLRVEGVASHAVYDATSDEINEQVPNPWDSNSNTLGYSEYGSLGQYTVNGTIPTPGNNYFNISIANPNTAESGTMTFTVTRTGNLSSAASVDFDSAATLPAIVGATYPDVAIAADFAPGTSLSGTLNFAINEATKTISLPVLVDGVAEPEESIDLVLSNPSAGWVLGDSRETGKITDGGNVEVNANGSAVIVEEGGVDDSYELQLDQDPGGSVTVQVTADSESLVSLDGVAFSNSVSVVFTDTTVDTIYVRAADDSDEEGTHVSVISHQITSTTSSIFSTALMVDDVSVSILDDDLTTPVLAAVDFDQGGAPHPQNWASLAGQSQATTLSNLVDENGATTTIDLTIAENPDGNWSSFGANIIASTVPQHTVDLTEIAGQIYNGSDTFVLTYSDLVPGAEYSLFVFAAESFYSSIQQRVTVTGDSTMTFDQSFTSQQLFVNDQVGDSSRQLSEYAKVMAADASGNIVVEVEPISGTNDVVLAGVAISPSASVEAEIEGRHIFYNNSSFDNSTAGPSADDDGAIVPSPADATDPTLGKTALLPGQAASFVNYTNYSRGINGIMIDVSNVADPDNVDAGDFQFRTGNSDDLTTWTNAPAPSFVDVREGEGVNGSDRITVVWADNVIEKEWLEVRILGNQDTGLAEDDVHYWGNAIGETGDSTSNAFVNATDIVGTRDNPHNFLSPADIEDAYDFNRDARVNATDIVIARDNATFFLNALKLISIPPPSPYVTQNVTFLGQLSLDDLGAGPSDSGSDVWGWTDSQTGRDYALMTNSSGTSFVDVTNGVTPELIGYLPSFTNSSQWRDVKVYQDHAYIVSDNNGPHGMQVFDLTQLRNVSSPPQTFTETAHFDGFRNAHNIF
ncbi:MAG: choice-of-anchor B family protein, partial [Planctomycetota bacterium]